MRALLLVLIPALDGCFFLEAAAPFYGSSSDWLEVGPINRPPKELFEFTWRSMERQGFTITQYYDPEERWIETDWQLNLSTRYREGFRTKLEAQIRPAESGGLTLRVRARREINDNAKQPDMEERAIWVAAGVDDRHKRVMGEPALRLRQTLRLKYFGINND